MSAVTKIMESLHSFFAEQDAQVAASDIAWALERAEAVREFKRSPEATELRKKGAFGGYYPKIFAIAGGKTWFNAFEGRSNQMISEFMAKNSKAVAEKRNAKIAVQLVKLGVASVDSAEVSYCKDGFNGVFKINGERFVKIESILAGGHTVQRLHQRVLVRAH